MKIYSTGQKAEIIEIYHSVNGPIYTNRIPEFNKIINESLEIIISKYKNKQIDKLFYSELYKELLSKIEIQFDLYIEETLPRIVKETELFYSKEFNLILDKDEFLNLYNQPIIEESKYDTFLPYFKREFYLKFNNDTIFLFDDKEYKLSDLKHKKYYWNNNNIPYVESVLKLNKISSYGYLFKVDSKENMYEIKLYKNFKDKIQKSPQECKTIYLKNKLLFKSTYKEFIRMLME